MKWYIRLILAFIISVFGWSIDFVNMRFDYYPVPETIVGILITWLPIYVFLIVLVKLLDFLFDIEKPEMASIESKKN